MSKEVPLICTVCGRSFHYDALGADPVHDDYTPEPWHYATLKKKSISPKQEEAMWRAHAERIMGR